MLNKIHAIRGMKDYLPEETGLLQRVEGTLKDVLTSYGYREIRFPIIENTHLFKSVIGEETDVVSKEMYSFDDRNGESLSLRPEGTVGCVRAGIENCILKNKEQRLWYIGPMFRRERPQKGRYRQFNQLGVEVFGHEGPDIEAELISLTVRCWKVLGINEHVALEVNAIGSVESRSRYIDALREYLVRHENKLDEDIRLRMHRNPMRLLDSNKVEMNDLLNDAPVLKEYLDEESRRHFACLIEKLDKAGIKYKVNKRLVRGLDYYNSTVFEWDSKMIGEKCTVCAGGRYDSLVEQLGGYKTPAVGFAIGIERLMILVHKINTVCCAPRVIDAYIFYLGEKVQFEAMLLAERVRDALPYLRIKTNYGCVSLKKQFSLANKYGARIALVLGESEVSAQKISVKNLKNGTQKIFFQSNVAEHIAFILGQEN